ncbi:MAG TPA: hypothetical protein VGI40_28640 [Pirellulaceae bacterium]|jgi:hypothetical protein
MTLLLAAHLLCVNVAGGGPIVGAWLDWRVTRGDEAAAGGAVYLGRASWLGLLFGAVLGVLIGWLKWDAEYESLWLGPMSYKMKWAIVEAVFSLVLIGGWWLWLPRKAGGSRWAMCMRSFIAVLAATNLLYHFPMLFSVAAQLQEAGETTGAAIGGRAFRALVHTDTILLTIHVTLASIAVAGVVLAGLASRLLRHGETEMAAVVARWSGRWALVPSLAQLPVGLFMLTVLPPPQQAMLMGNNTVGVLLFVGAIFAALWLVNDLAQLGMGEVSRPLLIRAMTAMVVTVVLMTGMQVQTQSINTGAPKAAKSSHR